jgi:RNA polymerase sigma factor (TIGR02999 family)
MNLPMSSREPNEPSTERTAGGDRAGSTGDGLDCAASGRGPEAGAWVERVYDELRGLGRRLMERESTAHTLQPTVLVHEAYLRLARENSSAWNDETHFRAVAATIMRRLLVDHARGRAALKRGGGSAKLALESIEPADPGSAFTPEELLALDEALTDLREASERQARVVELRFFGGMRFEQIARELGVSMNTAKNDWRFALAWLARKLRAEDEESSSDGAAGP